MSGAEPHEPPHAPPGDAPDVAPDVASGAEPDEQDSPYRNLWVPLVIVPAAIVVAIVLVFVFFGAISGTERTPAENLEDVLTGGSNERTQATFNLVRQSKENVRALAEGREPEWEMGPEFRERLERAWDGVSHEDIQLRYVLASLQAQLDEPGGLSRLIELLELPESGEAPVGGDLRMNVLYELGVLAPRMEPATAARASEAIRGYLHHADQVLRQVAAASLQNLPTRENAEALQGLLGAEALGLRGQAAISLSHMGDDAGAGVLWELVEPESYEIERRSDPTRWTRADNVSATRVRAVEALGRLGRPADRGPLEALAEGEGDLDVREAAMRAVAGLDGDG